METLNFKNTIVNPFVIPGIKKLTIDSRLNCVFQFDNFIEGKCNGLARSAAFAVATNPGGTALNPLFIYGYSGTGKTHLAQAIGNHAKEYFEDLNILYLNASELITQLTHAFRTDAIADFLTFYQNIDFLIIDDIQQLSGKDKMQDIFFMAVDFLKQHNKQMIFTADNPPSELMFFQQRLIGRFKWGLTVDLNEPDFADRLTFINSKAKLYDIAIEESITEYVASKISPNMSELEGIMISFLAATTLDKKKITMDVAQNIIQKLIGNNKQELTIDYIQRVVCKYFNMPVEVMNSMTRKREVVQCRQIAMYFSKDKTKSSLATIGSQIGDKDHATVLHAVKTVNNLMDTDKKFKDQLTEIERQFNGHHIR